MANIQLSWTNPTANDIDYICVHRFDADQSSTYNGSLDATEATAFAASQTTILNTNDPSYSYSDGAVTFTDTTAATGNTYTYGVFSKNGAGYGPGEAETITI